ncbi:hypothetical protein AGMMS49928_27410 [Spirochaetia bacterium]|nr:hypothetical protein AGMMS49928_27410 [Spirochaetia bacterium]
MKRFLLFLPVAFFSISMVFAADFGVTINQNPEFTGSGSDTDFNYSGGIGPWLSASLNEKLDLYLSGSLYMQYKGEEWKFIPELNRFSLSWSPKDGVFLDAGRIRYSDPLGLVATGLFDGVSGSFGLASTRLSVGAYYTGFLYKDTADIYMTADDYTKSNKVLEYSDFGATYFASRRILASVCWDVPSIFASPHALNINGIAQFDLNGRDDALHSQYIDMQFIFSPISSLNFTLGAIVGIAESKGNDTELSLAGLINADWQPPTAVHDVFTLGVRWGSGRVNDSIGPFRPITTIREGNVLDASLPGIIVFNAGYMIRPVQSLSTGLEGRYFLRSDLVTFSHAYLKGGDERAIGGEFYGSITWVPVVDVSVVFGGGAFFPGMGNALASDAPLQWKLSMAFVLSL